MSGIIAILATRTVTYVGSVPHLSRPERVVGKHLPLALGAPVSLDLDDGGPAVFLSRG